MVQPLQHHWRSATQRQGAPLGACALHLCDVRQAVQRCLRVHLSGKPRSPNHPGRIVLRRRHLAQRPVVLRRPPPRLG
jgi:hypothetical protein